MKSVKLYLLFPILLIAGFVFGCSQGESPIARDFNPSMNADLSSLPVGVSDWNADGSPIAGMGVMGLFNVNIDFANMSASMEPVRKLALADVLEVVDITNFLQLAPCTDCAKIRSVSIDADGNLVLSIGIKHPFEAGNPLEPITGRNRADLHVFNVEGIVISDAPGTSFPGLGESVSGLRLLSADGYTGYLDDSLDEIFPTDASVHPYVLHFDDYSAGNFDPDNPMGFASVTEPPPSGNLVMAMGCDYNYQGYIFDIDNSFDFMLAIGCTYAVSAALKSQRFNPEYRIPQHNKKSASEVSIEIISNDLKSGDTSSTAQLEVHVVDISHGVAVGAALNEMFADSSVGNINIEVPVVTSAPVVIDGSTPISGSGHNPLDPLIYQGTIINSLGAPGGDYSGLVKVTDNYSPGLNESPILNEMDGIKRVDPDDNPLSGLFAISEFAAYQVFSIGVSSEVQVTVMSIAPDEAYLNDFVDNAIITGSGFINVTSVRLEKDIEIIEAATFAVDSETQITADFDLAGYPTGVYDLVVEVQGGGTGSLYDGFEILFECDTGIHNTLQYEGTYQLNWNQARDQTWHYTYDIASLRDGRILMQGFSGNVPCLMAFDVTQNGLINGQVIVSSQWGADQPNWIMSMDVCEITGNIAFILASGYGKLIVFDSSGGHVDSIPSTHEVYCAVDTDWEGGIWTVEYILNSDSPPLGIRAFLEHYQWTGSVYVHNPSYSLEITSDLELNPCKVTEIGIVHSAKRLILLEHSSNPDTGNMYNYDLSGGAPVLMPSLTQHQFLSSPLSESQIGHWQKAFDIEIDHSDPAFEKCRIVLARRSGSGWDDGSYFTKYDTDMNMLGEYHVPGTPSNDHLLETFSLCPDPNDPDGIFLTIHEGWLSHPDMDAFEVYAMPVDW